MDFRSLVAIVGRPNVGKSTLFNRLIQKRKAIEEKSPGVTRDRLYGRVEWRKREFLLVDTGGVTLDKGETLVNRVWEQTKTAISQAAVVLFIVDGQEGVTALDEQIADLLRKSRKEIILVVNKIDSPKHHQGVYPFFSLGLGDPAPVSAQHGLNIGDLLDMILKVLPEGEPPRYGEDAIKVAVVGRPNVGKSSLINTLLREERVIVSEAPGTTRDAIDTFVVRAGKEYVFVDTAGIRRKSSVKEDVEYYSVLRSLRAIEEATVALLILDAAEKITEQDLRIGGYVHEAGRGLVIILNKWDKVANIAGIDRQINSTIRERFAFASYAPHLGVSARTGLRVNRLFPLIDKVHQEHRKRIPTALVNSLLADAIDINPPPKIKGKQLQIYYGTQAGTGPPTFVFFINEPSLFHFSYKRYLENRLREAFGFTGTPVRIQVRKRRRKGRDQ